MQRATNSTSACASCKHQRKKCTEKCALAPYFPTCRTREFQAVHKVFGVSNVGKIIKNIVKEEDRIRAVDSLVWEALCRQKEPVLGPYGEYARVCEELRFYKSHYQQQFQLVQNQGRIVHESAQALIGWNNNKVIGTNAGGINNNVNIDNNNNNNNDNNNIPMNNIHGNGNSVVGFFPYGYSSPNNIIQDADKIARAERENGNAVILPQHHLANGFNQQFFLTGQYNRMESKSMESTLWECSS